MNVIVTAYDPHWPELYEQEAKEIRHIFGDELVNIHHIGSTAVPGISAKPIIDILLIIKDIRSVNNFELWFRALGYKKMEECSIPQSLCFYKGDDEITHQIYVLEQRNQNGILCHLAVRDFLRCHPLDAYAYGMLKTQLAYQYSQDIQGYCKGKEIFIKELIDRALQWYRS